MLIKTKTVWKCHCSWLFKKHPETHKTKQINCLIICRETVRKLIDRLERLGYYVHLTYILQTYDFVASLIFLFVQLTSPSVQRKLCTAWRSKSSKTLEIEVEAIQNWQVGATEICSLTPFFFFVLHFYNVFITCIHKSWIYESSNFFHEIFFFLVFLQGRKFSK